MNIPTGQDELFDLLEALLSGAITPPQHRRLEERLAADPTARQFYFDYIDLHLHLRQWQRTQSPIPVSAPLIPPIILDLSPTPHASVFSLQSPLGSFLFSYTTSAILLGVAALIGWAWKLSDDQQVARSTPSSVGQVANLSYVGQSGQPAAQVPLGKRDPPLVARITGMVDCRWTDSHTAPVGFDRVSLGRKYALASGLMEITYDTGAKVILQGPCTYEVESTTGGYLSLGKLTARVEKKNKVVSGQWSAISEAQSQEHYPPATGHYPLFSVRTPTAVVTDLGTEFGVEVDKKGRTESHVYAGEVRVVYVGGKDESSGVATLHAGQTSRFDNSRGIVVVASSERAGRLVRGLGLPLSKTVRIVEKFDGSKLGAAFEQTPPGRYVNRAGAAVYQSTTSADGEPSRGYIRTVMTDFCDRDFVFEATVQIDRNAPSKTSAPRGGIYFGIGDVQPYDNYKGTTNCRTLFVKFDGGIDRALFEPVRAGATVGGLAGKPAGEGSPVGGSGRVRCRLRMVKNDRWLRISADLAYTGRFKAGYRVPPIDLASAPIDATNARLFLGVDNRDTTRTVRFEDLSLTYTKTLKERAAPGSFHKTGSAAETTIKKGGDAL